MICESGRVVSVDGEWVWVETLRTSSCVKCSAKAGCGQSLLNSIFAGKRHYVKVAANGMADKVHLHDQVEIAIPEHGIVKGSFVMYLFPLLMLIVGAGMAQEMAGSSDAYTIAGAAAGFLLSLLLVRLHAFLHRADPTYQPVLHRIISSASAQVVCVQ